MTEKLTKLIVDCETGNVEEVDLTPEEITQLEADKIAYEAAQAAREAEEAAIAEAKASAESKLTAMGLTAEEIAALTK